MSGNDYAKKLCPIRAHAAEMVHALVYGATGEQTQGQPPVCIGPNCGFWMRSMLRDANGNDVGGRCGIANGGRS